LTSGEIFLMHFDERIGLRHEKGRFVRATNIDDGTVDMWLQQLALQNNVPVVAAVLGDWALSQATDDAVDALLRWHHRQETDGPGEWPAFDALAVTFGAHINRLGHHDP